MPTEGRWQALGHADAWAAVRMPVGDLPTRVPTYSQVQRELLSRHSAGGLLAAGGLICIYIYLQCTFSGPGAGVAP